ncbi:MAG: DUF2298 domain-containing protein [Dehalococcoidia bacterium]
METLKWLFTAELLGLAVAPIVYAAFPNLADRGWGFAKPVGLLLVGFGVWILSYFGILPNSPWAWWLVTLLIAAPGLVFAIRHGPELRRFVRAKWPLLVVGEALFIGFFLVWVLVKSYDPAISGTEKPMDFMLLNASAHATAAPPEDAWLSGHPVAYYYFGYWMFGGLAQASGVQTSVAFNLSIALIAGMAAAAIFSLVAALVRRDGGSMRSSLLVGAAGAGLLLVVSSLAGWWELLAHIGVGSDGFYDWLGIENLDLRGDPASWRPDEYWWWWRASRIINTFAPGGAQLDFTIQEFPFFSLLLGDLHPHLMSIPFVLTGLGAVLNIHASARLWGFGWLLRHKTSALLLVLVTGAVGFINAWDIAFLAAVLLGAVTLKVHRERMGSLAGAALRAASPLILIGVIGVIAFSPFYFGTLSSQIQWPPIGPAAVGTRPIHLFTVWGLLLLLPAALVVTMIIRSLRPHANWLWAVLSEVTPPTPRPSLSPWLLAMVAVLLPYLVWTIGHLEFNEGAATIDLFTRLLTAGPLAVAVVVLLVTVAHRAKQGAADGVQFVLLISMMAVYLIYGAELLFVHDLFGNRMNTVFKFYYQAWIILAAASAYGLFYWTALHKALHGWPLAISRTGGVLATVLLVGSLYYPVAAVASKTDDFSGPMTLDGLAYLESGASSERSAINWLKENAESGDRIVEAVDGSYTDHGRIAASTGLPTILAWPGHQRQWRGGSDLFDGRESEVERFYTTDDVQVADSILKRYGVTYVIVGQRERARYPSLFIEKFDTLGSRAFEEDSLIIYRVQEGGVDD